MKTALLILTLGFVCNSQALAQVAAKQSTTPAEAAIATPALITEPAVTLKIKTSDGKLLSESELKEAELGVEFKTLIVEQRSSKLGPERSSKNSIQTSAQERTEDLVVEQRFETSLSVQNDGPHLDFTEWKHGFTPWVELKSSADGFQILATPEEDLPFPNVSAKEIRDYFEIYKKQNGSGAHWDSVVVQCSSATQYPCSVGVSKIVFQIKSGKDPKKILRKLEILIPMGC